MERKYKIGLVAAAIVAASMIVAARQKPSSAEANASSGAALGTVASTGEVAGGMRRVEVIDPLFNIPAYSVMIPNDWTFDGGILRPHLAPSFVFRASSKDGLTGMQMMPRTDWVMSDNPQTRRFYENERVKVMQPIPAADFLKRIALAEVRPGVPAGADMPIRFMDELHARDQKMNEQFAAQAAQHGQRPNHITSDAAAVRLQYDFNGHPVEEVLQAVVTVADLPHPNDVLHMSQAELNAGRAPRGKLDESMPLFKTILASVTVNPAWQQKQDAYALAVAQNKNAAILAYAKQRQAQNDAVFNRSMANTAAMEAARHQGAVATADHMGDVQAMVNPATGQTGKVSNQYNYSYVDQNGNVVHTNSATYNPNAELRGNWTQLQPIKP